jgi:uncharacterized membrane protein YhaH (DUF805 family)
VLTEPIRGLIAQVAEHHIDEHAESGSVLEINSIISAAATFYEKIRYLIDYREEHTIRRAAIERVLKRYVLIEGKVVGATEILQELVESQYLPKEFATERLMHAIETTLERFMQLQYKSGRTREMAKVLLSIAATEIESRISTHEYAVDEASAEALYKVIRPHIILGGYAESQIDVQAFCGCRRALLSSDDATLMYALWLKFIPDWNKESVDLDAVAQRLQGIVAGMQHAIAHPLQWQIAQRIKNESIYFRIIREIFMQHYHEAEEILSTPEKLDSFTKEFLHRKYDKENTRIQSSGIRAVIYLFLTKMTVALIVEAPYENFILGGINYVTLAINLLFHPLLLFALTRRVRSLGEGNTTAILDGLHRVVYRGEGRPIRIYTAYTRFTRFFGFFYLLLFLGVFGAIVTMLQFLNFSTVGMTLFLFFLALVSYFAFRIRSNARRWRVSGQDSTAMLVANMLAVPVIRAGRYLSTTFSSINIFVMILDFLIETPFRLILNFSHQFILYLREKADEIY